MDYVFEQLAAGATAVTSTRRLARYLLERFSAHKLHQNETVWPTPKTYAWDEWLLVEWYGQTRSYPSLGRNVVLEDQQEAQLWESIIRNALQRRPDVSLLQTSATARAAKDTWRMIHDWQIPLDCLTQTYIEDTQAFYDWASEFRIQANHNNWVCACEISSLLRNLVESRFWLPGSKVLLIGFDEWLPSQQGLIDALQGAGSDIEKIVPPRLNKHAEVLSCTDRRNEFEAAAQWSKSLLASGEMGPIGIIVDDLRSYRNDIEVIFDQILHPTESVRYDESRRRAFHISLGKSLAEYPIIAAALMLLRFMISARPIDEVTRLLHTPFTTGGLSESSLRSSMDVEMRQRGWNQVSLAGLIRFTETTRVPVVHLLKSLRQAIQFETKSAKSPTEWSETFMQWLSLFGWPGERTLNSNEYQTVQAWREILARFARLTMLTPKLDCEQAVNSLRYLTQQRVFQPRSEPAQVQIMGVLEASGMAFSHLWISGASDDTWPPPSLLNPFLPYAVQRRFKLPGAVAEEELARCSRVAARLIESAKDVVVSFPRQRQDHTQHLSSIFQDLPESLRKDEPFNLTRYIQKTRPVLEKVNDSYGPAYDDSPLSGGVSIFKDQAACPFRAFARHRLMAFGRPDVEPGLTPAERGILVHACIAEFWREIRTATALKALSDDELEKVLVRHVGGAITKLGQQAQSSLRQAILDIERKRLLTLLREWLHIERTRDAFEVSEVEQKINSRFSGIDISLRIDRIDQLADGRRVIIDYKTGREIRVEHWLGDRPDDPQLPLYLLCISGEFSALAFAHLRKGASGFKGLSQSKGFAKGVHQHEDWAGLQARWQQVLGDLAEQFRVGYARVDPKDSKVCQLCDVMSFCRIFDVRQRRGGQHD